jgi:hypothetical protein
MDALLCLPETTHLQSMELARPEAIYGLESGTRSRLWSTREHCACVQEVAFFGIRLAGTPSVSTSGWPTSRPNVPAHDTVRAADYTSRISNRWISPFRI